MNGFLSTKINKIDSFVKFLSTHSDYSKRIVHIEKIPPREENLKKINWSLPELLKNYLKEAGIDRLYLHQTEAIEKIREGKNVVITTTTGSGKTLIYNLCVWESILRHPETRALYLFPTKALTQDQLGIIEKFTSSIPHLEFTASVYDGDTSAYRRKKIRENPPHILLTNPDMLQMGILPFHSSWRRFLSKLNFIILDELHTYRGVFGTHVAHILRRLKRILKFYGSSPQFIASSATIEEPEEFAESLTNEKFVAITEDGSPAGKKYFILWNSQTSPYTEATELFAESLRFGLKSILFTKSRRATELVYSWLNEGYKKISSRISSYRAGYLPSERRNIEKALFSGKLKGIISTSALELGIDVGELDCCILLGYPGTIISTWQRGGRAGRGKKDALIVMIALDDALDQYFLRHPRDFFSRGWEKIIINVKNEVITCEHLICAASEIPLSSEDKNIYGKNFFYAVKFLEKKGNLLRDKEGSRWYSRGKYPQRGLNIRSIGETYSIINLETNKIIGQIDETRVYNETYPGAIYLHRMEEFEIVNIDETTKCIYAYPRFVDYYTQSSSREEIEIISLEKERKIGKFGLCLGKIKVTRQITGFEKIKKDNNVLISEHFLNLPEQSFDTVSFWLKIPPEMRERMHLKGINFHGAIHALEHATIAILPLKITCDRNDIGGYSFLFHFQTKTPTVFIYDGYPGGLGLAEEAFKIPVELFKTTLELVEKCACKTGCPSCIHSPRCGSRNRPLDKEGAISLLKDIVLAFSQENGKEIIIPENLSMVESPKKPNFEKEIIFFDLETQKIAQEVGGWNYKELMRLAIGITYNLKDNKFRVYRESEVGKLLKEILQADKVVGFNIKRFDYAVLSRYTSFDFSKIDTLDLLEVVEKQIGSRLSLDHLAKVTLGYGKIGNGLEAVRWFKEGKIERVINYCKHDVKLTKELYEYGKKNGYLLFKDKYERILRIPVNW